VEDLVKETPVDVWTAFEEILKRSKDVKKTEMLIRLVLAAAQPLTVDEANIALALALSSEEDKVESHSAIATWDPENFLMLFRDFCHFFVEVYEDQLVFIHQTAREFFTKLSKFPGSWQGRFTLSSSHSVLSTVCLQYLLLGDFRQPIGVEAIINQWYPFYQYAADNWVSQYHAQDDNSKSRFRSEATCLCDEDIPQSITWKKAYNGLNCINIQGTHVLNVASFLDLTTVIDCVLVNDADSRTVNKKDDDGWTPLMCASAVGSIATVRKLLTIKDVNVEATNESGQTPLMLAAAFGNQSIVALLLDYEKTSVNVADRGQRWTALIYAVNHGEPIIVEMLLSVEGIDIALKDTDNKTALDHALEIKNDAIVELLQKAELGPINTSLRGPTSLGKPPWALKLPGRRVHPAKKSYLLCLTLLMIPQTSSRAKRLAIPNTRLAFTTPSGAALPMRYSGFSGVSNSGPRHKILGATSSLVHDPVESIISGRKIRSRTNGGLPESNQKLDLASQLRASIRNGHGEFSDKPKKYVPLDALQKLVNRENVEAELRKIEPNFPYSSDEICGRSPGTKSRHLAKTYRQKIFAILLLIQKVEAVANFIHHNITDGDLPFSFLDDNKCHDRALSATRTGATNPFAVPKDWPTSLIYDFLQTQWMFLSPYFLFPTASQPNIFHYEFSRFTVLPWETYLRNDNLQADIWGDVCTVTIHPAHRNYDMVR
jgi:ankyrin repeat protein